jgi:hypothetical protein
MNPDHDESTLLNKALKTLLAPLVRLLIKKQVSLSSLTEIIKSVYVDVAEQDFAIKGKPLTDSRINLLTGVHRKDVKRLRGLAHDDSPSERLSINHLMLGTWLGDERYQQARGCLPFQGDISFESLANSISRKNIRASSILENWLEMGWLLADESGLLHLQVEQIHASQVSEDQLYFFAHNMADHLATGTHNLSENNKHLERAVFYNQLSPQSIDELECISREKATELLLEINQQALKLQLQDEAHKEAKYRFRLGCYFYRDPENKETDEAPL